MLTLRLLLPAAAFALLLPALIYWRGYPWQLALLTGLAIAGLLYAALRTVENMRSLLGDERAVPGGGRHRGKASREWSSAESSPGNDRETGGQ